MSDTGPPPARDPAGRAVVEAVPEAAPTDSSSPADGSWSSSSSGTASSAPSTASSPSSAASGGPPTVSSGGPPSAASSVPSSAASSVREAPPVRRRGRGVSGTVADMARSLGVLIACVAVVWFVSGMWHVSTHRSTGVADWRAEVTEVAPTAAFALEAPATLPSGWAVSALQLSGSGSSGEWTMSVTTPAGHYLDLDQAAGSVASRVGAVLPSATPDGRVVLTAGSWSRYRLPADAQGRGESALARGVAATAVVISGTGTLAEQTSFADALRATR